MNKKTKPSHAPRGSVMVLVVAVLGLLVVIGTIYITSSRTERATSQALASSANTNLTRDAVMAQVQQTIGNSMVDGNKAIGGYAITDGGLNLYGTQAARNYDYPELGTTFGKTNANPNMRDEPWLVVHLHNQALAGYNEFSLLTALPFDPSKGTYGSTNITTNYPFPYATIPTNDPMSTIVGDQTNYTAPPPSPLPDQTKAPDDPTTTNSDGYMNLLPFSDASGTRYRFGVRILDTNRMANLNTGAPDDSAAILDTTGTYITSFRLAPKSGTLPVINGYFDPNNKYYSATADFGTSLQVTAGANNTGRIQTTPVASPFTPFNAATWQQQILQIEKLPFASYLSLYDTTDELELRSYGEFGTPSVIRPAIQNGTIVVWPNTLGNTKGTAILGNPRRRNYTTYSFSREVRSYLDPVSDPSSAANWRFTLAGANIWPQSYARVPVNAVISAPNDLATAATNLATAMMYTTNKNFLNSADINNTFLADGPSSPYPDGTVPFTQNEIASFTANYLEYRGGGMTPDPTISVTTAYYLPFGPSFVSDTTLCVRGATAATSADFGNGSSTDVKASTGTMCIGYSAQPFINEVAVTFSSPDMGMTVTPADYTVELFNPYPVALSLNGYKLKCGGTDFLLPAGAFIPANGYYVYSSSTHFTSTLVPSPAPGGIQELTAPDTTFVVPTVTPSIILYRPLALYPFSTLNGFAAIDQVSSAQLTALMNPTPASITSPTPVDYSISRNFGSWGSELDIFSAPAVAPNVTIGLINNTNGASGIQLYDRFATASPPAANAPFTNIADFNLIMRISNQVTTAGDPSLLLTDQLQTLTSTAPAAPYSNMQFPIDAQLHFDFRADPGIYKAGGTTTPLSAAPTDYASPPIKQGDIRAVRFLDQIAMIDRVSDTTINVGGGVKDINKIRLPGQINVNTASGDVLRALPGLAQATVFPTPELAVANILAYRARQPAGVVYGASTTTVDYSDQSKYPGYGFRSVAELMIPISDAIAPGSFSARDTAWASIYNLCTVRSDTFVVYGYLEAIRQNPNFTGSSTFATPPFNNNTHWYTPATDSIYTTSPNLPIDDPHNTGPLIRVARRRWVAIIDRSFSNYAAGTSNFSLPKIVAIKDLPQ